MKKIASVILAIAIMLTMSTSVLAANFVDSIEAKPAPKVVEIEDNSKFYGALLIDDQNQSTKSGASLYDENAGSVGLEFVVISAAEKSQAALPAITKKIEDAEKQIKAVKNLGELTSGIDKSIQKVIDAFYGNSKDKISINDLVISDLFDASLIANKAQLESVPSGQKVRFMLKPSFTEDDFFVLLHNTDGSNWEVVDDVKWTPEGNLLVTADSLSAFAIAVPKNADLPVDPNAPDSPQTSHENKANYNFLYAGIAVLCAGAAIFFFVKSKKRRTAK